MEKVNGFELKPSERIMEVHGSYTVGSCFEYEGNIYNVISILGSGKYPYSKRALIEKVM